MELFRFRDSYFHLNLLLFLIFLNSSTIIGIEELKKHPKISYCCKVSEIPNSAQNSYFSPEPNNNNKNNKNNKNNNNNNKIYGYSC